MTGELEKLAHEYDRFCQRIEPRDLPYSFLIVRHDDGSPHVEFTDGQYHYIVTERGLEVSSRSTGDISDVLYWLVYDLTFWMGVEFEFRNRVEGQDVRRVIFARSLLLMKRADKAMAERLERQIANTLAENPYQD